MRQPRHRSSFATLALAGALALAGPSGCGPTDPLDEVRELQSKGAGGVAESYEPLRELVAERPDDPEVNFRYGVALGAVGKRTAAVFALEKAMTDDAWLESAGLVLAQVYRSIGNFDDAIEVCDRILARDPDSIDALLQRAHARTGSRRYYAEALEDAERVLEIDPDNRDALLPRVLALLHFERVEEAGAALEDLEAAYRDEEMGLLGIPALCAARAVFAHEKGDTELAAERFDACLERVPDDVELAGLAIDFFDSVGRRERSQEILEGMLERQPSAHVVRSEIARRLAARGDREGAKELVREATELPHPLDAAQGWATLALFELEDDRFEAAADAFERAYQLDPAPGPELVLGYADALAVAGRYERAIQVAESAGQPAFAALVRGRVALERGEPREALAHFERGIRLWPDNPVARYYSAIAAERIGDFARATEDYRYAMRIRASATDAYLRLARIQAASGALDQAVGTLEFRPGSRPHEPQAMRLLMRITAERGTKPSQVALGFFGLPGQRANGLAAMAEGVRERTGAAAAVDLLLGEEDVDLEDPANLPALAALVEALGADGRADEALRRVDAALAAHPDVAALRALRGRALQLAGASDDARAAFERALEDDAALASAQRGLGDLDAAAGRHASALAHYDAAADADAGDLHSARRAAEMLVALGRDADAEERLEALLREHPYDAEAAIALAERRLARGVADARTRELAQRAVYFGGGAEAEALRERVAEADAPAEAEAG